MEQILLKLCDEVALQVHPKHWGLVDIPFVQLNETLLCFFFLLLMLLLSNTNVQYHLFAMSSGAHTQCTILHAFSSHFHAQCLYFMCLCVSLVWHGIFRFVSFWQ